MIFKNLIMITHNGEITNDSDNIINISDSRIVSI